MARQQGGGGGGAGGGGGDTGLGPLWIGLLLLIVMLLIWTMGRRYIVSFVFSLNLIQAKFITLFIHNEELSSAIFNMETLNPETVDWNRLMEFTEIVGNYMRYPIILILIMLAFLLYNSNVTLKFRRAHNMKTLRAQEQHNWPAITPIIKEDIVSLDINKGPWAMALTPIEFGRKYQLLRKDDAILDNPVPGQEMTAGIRRSDAKRVFTLQLGPYWDGFEHCAPHVRALAAVFMARMNRDKAAASKILAALDISVAEGKPDYSVADSTLEKYKNMENVQEVIAKHAYLLPVMASLLRASRDDGVVPSSEFLWLKIVDRRLWYMLNSVGRQTPFVEVGGPFAHWRAEEVMGRRSLVPMVEEAIKAFEIAIKEVKLSPKEMAQLMP